MNYILYGKQYPMIKKRLDKVLKERIGEIDDFNVSKYDLENVDLDEAIDDAYSLPLGYERKAVIFDNVSFLSKGAKKDDVKKVLELVSIPNKAIDLFFIYRDEDIDKKSPIYEAIEKDGVVYNFMDLSKNDWDKYVRKYFSDREVKIDDDAINELILRVNGDLNKFINEADKLCLYKKEIKLVDIVLMVSKPLEDNAFEMCNALLKGDNAIALSIYRDLKMLGSRATDSLIPLLSSQFRFISQVFYLYAKGFDADEIANELKANRYRVIQSLKLKSHLKIIDVARALDDLYYLDYNIKSGQIDRFYGFELFLINFPN